MDIEKFHPILAGAVAKTFESMIFMEAPPCDHPPNDADSANRVLLEIIEPHQGKIIMAAPPSLLRKLAGIILVQPESDINEQSLNDLLSELLNTLAGCLLTNALPEKTSFKLGLPKILPLDAPQLSDMSAFHFSIEEQSFTIYIAQDIIQAL